MNAIQKLAKNIGSLFVAQILSYVIAFIYSIYLIRYLGVENFGLLSYAIALTSILTIFSDLGLNTLMTREVAKDKSITHKYLKNVISIKLLLSITVVTLTVVIINNLGYSQSELYVIYFLLITLVFNTFSTVFSSIFQAYEKLEYQSVANILNSILMFIGVIIAIKYNSGLIFIASLYAIISGLLLIFYLWISTSKFDFPLPNIETDLKFWKPTIITALQFGLIGVFTTIYVWIDSVMLSFMINNQAVGLYNAAYRIVMVLLFVPMVMNAAFFPFLSKLYGSKENSLNKIVEKYTKFMIIIGIPLGIAVTFLAKNIIVLLFGNAYIGSVIALQILVWSTVITFIYTSYVSLFLSSDKQMALTKIAFVGMVVNITLNLIFIPKYSYIAASFNTVLTEFTIIILLFITTSRDMFLNKKQMLNDFIRVGFCGLIMAIILVLFNYLELFILITLATIIYLLALFITRTVDKEDIEIIRKIRG